MCYACRLNIVHSSSIAIAVYVNTGPDGAVAMSSVNGLVGRPYWVRISVPAPTQSGYFYKGPVGRCIATKPCSFSLTSNRVNTNY